MTMIITVLGARGTIGSRLADQLEERAHDVRRVSRRSGVDARTGVGLREALRGADVAVPGDLHAGLCALVRELDRALDSSAVLSHLLWREADTHPAVRDALQRRSGELEEAVSEVLAVAGADPGRTRGAARLLAAAIGHRHAVARHGDEERDGMEDELAFVAAALA